MSPTPLRILFVTPYVPSSVRIRPLAFIRELARLGHQVTLVCLLQPDWEAAYLSEVAPYCQAVHPVRLARFEPYIQSLTSLPTRTPLSVAYCRSKEFEHQVRYLVQKESFDLVHTEFVRAVPATVGLHGLPKVFDAVDSLALTHRRSMSAAQVPQKQRLVSTLEWLKMRRFEPWAAEQFDQVIVSSPADRQKLEGNGRSVEVIPNGVDIDYFSFSEAPREEATIVFLGKMSYYVNVASVLWFYHEVLPLVRRQRPDVKFQIVGRNPAPKISALGSDPMVEVTGTVPDVRPYLAQATVSVCPMVSGAGIQNKMLEAMAVGAPTLATSLACQALQSQSGRDVEVADSPRDFASSILELLADPQRRQALSEHGRSYVENHHVWSRIGKSLDQLYSDLMSRSPKFLLSLEEQIGW